MESLHNVFYQGLRVEDIGSDNIICIIKDTDIRYSESDTSKENKKIAEEYFSYKHGYDIDNIEFVKSEIDQTKSCCDAWFRITVNGVSDDDIETVSDCLDKSRIIKKEIQSLEAKIESLNDEIEKFYTLKHVLESHREDIG